MIVDLISFGSDSIYVIGGGVFFAPKSFTCETVSYYLFLTMIYLFVLTLVFE